jgi:hypothetical protein
VQLSNFYLRKGFEVCGILEDVYVARKRNKLGQPYGFVRFSNVRDITKLTKALNAVCFGDFRVRARVARFDRNVVPFEEKVRAGVEQDPGGGTTTDVKVKETDSGAVAVKQPRIAAPAQKDTGVSDSQEGVRVGEVLVRPGERREKVDRTIPRWWTKGNLLGHMCAATKRIRRMWFGHNVARLSR